MDVYGRNLLRLLVLVHVSHASLVSGSASGRHPVGDRTRRTVIYDINNIRFHYNLCTVHQSRLMFVGSVGCALEVCDFMLEVSPEMTDLE